MTPIDDKVVPLRVPIPVGSVQGTLALDVHPLLDPPAAREDPGRPGGDVVPIDRQVRGRLEQWSRRYLQAAVEIVGGDRPVAQLLRWSSPAVYDDLQRRARLVHRAAGQRAGQGGVQAVRPHVRGVRTCFVATDAVEVSVHVRYGRRSRALAARFEYLSDRWQCVALEFA